MVGDGPLLILICAEGPLIIAVHVRHIYSVSPALYWLVVLQTTNLTNFLFLPLTISNFISKIFEGQPKDIEEGDNFYSILLIGGFKHFVLLVNTPHHLDISIFHPLNLMNAERDLLIHVLACNFLGKPGFK